MSLFAPAKLNLTLNIIGKNKGYHDLQSLVCFPDIGDSLRFSEASDLRLSLAGEFASAIGGENVVLEAARLLRGEKNIVQGAHIHLVKNIPVGAGLGGGSADAACVLRGLAEFWGCSLSSKENEEMALGLGSDVPACLVSEPLWLEGRGERLRAIRLPDFAVLLVYCGEPLCSGEMFSLMRPPFSEASVLPDSFADMGGLVRYIGERGNDFLPLAQKKLPAISEILDGLWDCSPLVASLSGSGSACFALFASLAEAERAGEKMKVRYPSYWVRSAFVNNGG
ncbi:MAG: 4-(cytidine 5'-diphospho)-2-C-methyl-D-erythritol kinase [Parvibaculales bacterium]